MPLNQYVVAPVAGSAKGGDAPPPIVWQYDEAAAIARHDRTLALPCAAVTSFEHAATIVLSREAVSTASEVHRLPLEV